MESPPPTILTAPDAATAWATASVPFAKASISNTPIGPFHTTILALLSAWANVFCDAGPISRAIQSSLIASIDTVLYSASAAKRSAIITSEGRSKFTPFSLAWPISERAKSSLSDSTKDFPVAKPCAAIKVLAMPPPIISVSTFCSKFSMTPILSETFAPPIMATKG